jgi:signal transduction histidine kinase
VKTRVEGPFSSLFWRLMLAFGTVVVATLLLSALIVNTILEGVFERQLAGVMLEDARGVALWAEPYLGSAGDLPLDLRPHLQWLHAVTEGRLWLVATSGVVLADTGAPGTPGNYRGTRLEHPWVQRVLSGEILKERGGDPWMNAAIAVGYPVTRGGKVIGAVFLFVTQTRLLDVFAEFRLQVALVVLGAALTGLLAAYTLSRAFARPIERMSEFAAGLGQKQFGRPLPDTRVTEMARLAQSLQGAAGQLQESFAALEEEKQRIQSLIQDMAEGVVAVDEHRRILLVNPAAGQLLGLPGPFDGLSLARGGFPERLVTALTEAAAPGGPGHLEVHFSVGGEELRAQVSQVVTEAGPPFGSVALLQSVTTEVQLRRLRENFVANVSHELRGPLASLSAGVEAMHDGLIPEASRLRFLKAMLSEIARLRRLVDDLLELSRLDAGMVQIAQEEFDLHPLCEGLAEKWEPRANAAGVRLEVDCPHMRVVANYDRVEEILTNFLDNAVRFTPSGGRVRLFARPEGEFVRAGVSDTGTGIEREHLAHIWDRFYKVDAARTRTRGAGTGLGLAIVKQLVELLGGEVQVESEPGKGSTFSFTLVEAGGAEPRAQP